MAARQAFLAHQHIKEETQKTKELLSLFQPDSSVLCDLGVSLLRTGDVQFWRALLKRIVSKQPKLLLDDVVIAMIRQLEQVFSEHDLTRSQLLHKLKEWQHDLVSFEKAQPASADQEQAARDREGFNRLHHELQALIRKLASEPEEVSAAREYARAVKEQVLQPVDSQLRALQDLGDSLLKQCRALFPRVETTGVRAALHQQEQKLLKQRQNRIAQVRKAATVVASNLAASELKSVRGHTSERKSTSTSQLTRANSL